MANSNIINAVFGSGICAVTTSAFRANYGMVLRFSGIDLPTAFEVDFSNYDVMGRDSITMIGQNGEVQIPDDLWDSGLNIYAYVYLHPTDDSGVTVYTVTIPVLGRPNRTDETPTPHEQTVIEQAISALNDAVEQTAADVVSADASAQAAAQSEANASASERAAAASASAALASQNAAESAAQGATESASGASESAQNAANSASQAAQSATSAQESAEQAEQAVQSITDDVERAERAAQTATGKATEAASSATAAAQSASSADSAASQAASSASSAESHATDAETAKQAAQDAQAAAEQAAESVSGLSEQIAQNTADIAELVLSKAGALVDTVSGSIASFVPDATVPTVKGLTVNVEPVQDLHGYDSPWPAGGGKNLGNFIDGYSVDPDGYVVKYDPKPRCATVDPIIIDESKSYVVSSASAGYRFIYAIWNNGTLVRRVANISNGTVLDVSGGTHLYLCLYESVTVSTGEPMVEIGTVPTSYAPYSNICPISGWDAIEVQRTGVNVWDEEWEQGAVNTSDGSERATSNTIRSKNYCELVGGSTYYATCGKTDGGNQNRYYIGIIFYDAEKRYISGGYYNNLTFTAPENARYFKLTTNTSTVVYGNTYNDDISINYPATDTAYHSGTNNTTYTIQFGQTVYGGTVDAVNGVLTVDRAMVKLDGNTPQNNIGITVLSAYTQVSYTPYITSGKGDGVFVSDLFKNVTTNNAQLYGIWNSGNAALPRMFMGLPTSVTDKASAVAWFAENPASVVYELATTITINLTPLEISVLTGQTNNVWADSGDVSVEYAADLKTYIDKKIAAAVAALS